MAANLRKPGCGTIFSRKPVVDAVIDLSGKNPI